MKAAIMGYGTIGSGVYEVLDKNCKSVEKKAGEPIEVKYILDLREFPGSPVEKLVIHDVEQIVNDPEIGIVVETMGGTKPAYEFVRRCLLAGKHVGHASILCSSSKKRYIRFPGTIRSFT